MGFSDLFSKITKPQNQTQGPTHWVKCQGCHSLMYYKEMENCFNVCPKCGYHMRISAQKRIDLLCDEGTFQEFDQNLSPVDPLKFVDKKSYKKRIAENEEKTHRTSSVISGEGQINNIDIGLIVFDFSFMGGSLGSVEGEKISRAVKRCIKAKKPLIIVSASGGARMQESTFSLMQMSKTSAALKMLSEEKIPYISVLTDPTMGGVSASFAMLGDLIIAEPGALIGFAGQRVIEQTIKAELPEGFQRSEFLLEHGLIDAIVERGDMKKFIFDMLMFFSKNNKFHQENKEQLEEL